VSDANARRGDLVGGKAEANKGIKAVALGATADTKTEVYCAMTLTDLKQQLKQLDKSIKSMVVAALNIEAQLRKLPPKVEWQDDAMMVEQVTVMLDEKRRIIVVRAQEELEYDSLNLEVENYYKHYRIDVLKHIFSNVELHIGNAFQRTQREHGPCHISNKNQEISFDYSH
ncbi:FapA family protein, partial [Shewanella sp. 0m-11]